MYQNTEKLLKIGDCFVKYTGGGPKKVAPYEDRVFRL